MRISIRKGPHPTGIVVSDLVRKRPIWFGGRGPVRGPAWRCSTTGWGPGRAAKSGSPSWTCGSPFRNATRQRAPQAGHPVRTSFHIMRHLGEGGSTKVRKADTPVLSGKDRRFIKGQKYTLLSAPREPQPSTAKRSLALLLARQQSGLNTAYLLKEAFGQLWNYRREGLGPPPSSTIGGPASSGSGSKPYERFAEIDRATPGPAIGLAYCPSPGNKVLARLRRRTQQTRSGVCQRRAYGLRDEEYLRLKVLTCMLPAL